MRHIKKYEMTFLNFFQTFKYHNETQWVQHIVLSKDYKWFDSYFVCFVPYICISQGYAVISHDDLLLIVRCMQILVDWGSQKSVLIGLNTACYIFLDNCNVMNY